MTFVIVFEFFICFFKILYTTLIGLLTLLIYQLILLIFGIYVNFPLLYIQIWVDDKIKGKSQLLCKISSSLPLNLEWWFKVFSFKFFHNESKPLMETRWTVFILNISILGSNHFISLIVRDLLLLLLLKNGVNNSQIKSYREVQNCSIYYDIE